jgi:hypothetical protein
LLFARFFLLSWFIGRFVFRSKGAQKRDKKIAEEIFPQPPTAKNKNPHVTFFFAAPLGTWYLWV